MRFKIIFIFMIAGLCFNSKPAWSSGADYGKTGAEILELNGPAGITAMGNANAGLADDLNAVIYNPAGLTQMYGKELQFTHMVYYLDTSMSSLTYGHKIKSLGFALKLKFFSASDIMRNTNGIESSTFDIRFSQYSLGVGIPVSVRNSLGVTLNSVSEKIYKESGSVIGFDVGWHYKGTRGDSFGLVVKNLGGKIKVKDEKRELPLKFVLGGGHKMGRFIFVWEVLTGRQIDFAWRCGMEAAISGLKLRAGFINTDRPDITLGFGLPYRNWCLDYAFFPHQDLGIAHRLSLGVYF